MYLRFAFLASFITYLLLVLSEVLQPGFVSHYFSAHWLLLFSLILFALIVHRDENIEMRPWFGWIITTFVAFVFAVVTWRLGEPLNELRPLLTLIALALPFAMFRTLDRS